MSEKENRKKLIERQKGISPLTRKPLGGQRLESHHILELCEGGDNTPANKQILPITEHLAVHYMRSTEEVRPQSERRRELQTVLGRLRQLTPTETKEFETTTYLFTGIKIRVIGEEIQLAD